jgi:putative CocE/NonD family hydrolase
MVSEGYVVAFVDARGSGASFGHVRAPFLEQEGLDAYDVTEWFAAQPWCTGRVGMFGRSYRGVTQYLAAAARPPHLRAIFPEMCLFDLYDFVWPGGVFRQHFAVEWWAAIRRLDATIPERRGDRSRPREWLETAVREHALNGDVVRILRGSPFRDSRDPGSGLSPYCDCNPASRLARIKDSSVAVYNLAGWQDAWPMDALLWHANLKAPRRIVVGPWSHLGSAGFDTAEEHLRWYDWHLRDRDDGISQEAAVHWHCAHDGKGEGGRWRSAAEWPPRAEVARWRFGPGPSGTIDSCNDGILTPGKTGEGIDSFWVDDTATSGKGSRWRAAHGAIFGYADMSANDRKGLTYTSEPLARPLEVTGHPVARLQVALDATDADFFVYLEEVGPDGGSSYLTEGSLRASCRRPGRADYWRFDLPRWSGLAADVQPCRPGEVIELAIVLHPLSHVFRPGNRMRISIAGCDLDNALASEGATRVWITLLLGRESGSWIELPVIGRAETDTS